MEEEIHNPDQSMDLLNDGEVFEFEEGEEMEEERNEEEIQPETQLDEWKPSSGFSNRAKIIEILKNLHSPEINIYSHSSKEFTSLLKSESGDNFLIELIQLSPNCTELIDAWKIHQNKPGLSHILSLLATILEHPAGKSNTNNSIRKSLDNLARNILTSKIDDIYSELNSSESKRQSFSLNLLASITKRGIGLASELAKNFNFKLPIISKLSGITKNSHRDSKKSPKRSTRLAFINFSMSFIESSNPRLLRFIIQQKELFSGVLRAISTDDSSTIIHILTLFRDKILNEQYLIPPGLRSVLFGSATLEQLTFISGNSEAGACADVAHQVLLTVCTDPRNGLMPGSGLKGNEKRLLDLMRKVRASENGKHRKLVLEICGRNVGICGKYLDEFPYHLEPRNSPSWFSAISLLADIISSLDQNALISSLSSLSLSSPSSQDEKLNLILKCITPQVCSRLILNKGLLHSDELVRHAALRTVLESLKILCELIRAINCVANQNEKLASLRSNLQEEVRANLPDLQVLLKLLSNKSSSNNKEVLKSSGGKLKRCSESAAEDCEVAKKKLKISDDDIMIGGINLEGNEVSNMVQKEGPDCKDGHLETVCEIWGLNREEILKDELIEMENIFRSKLLDVLTFYLRALPGSFEGSFDFIKILPTDPSKLSKFELNSLLSLLLEFISPSENSEKIPDSIYKHLHPLLNILLNSKENTTREKADLLVRAAMFSTGAFDYNNWEINCWLVFIPGYLKNENEKFNEIQFSNVVVSFLCDSISTVGNNLFKYLDQMRKFITGGKKPDFSPLVLCILQKCIRLLDSDSGSFKSHERTIISLYVCNSLSLILQSQVNLSSLAGLINSVLTEKFKDYSSKELDKKLSFSEWRPLKNLLFLSQNTLDKNYQNLFCLTKTSSNKPNKKNNKPFSPEMINTEDLICAKTEDIIANFPLILTTERENFQISPPFLASLLFLERDNLSKITNKWPELFQSGLKMTRGKTVNTDNEAGQFANYLLEAPFHSLFSSLVGSDLIYSTEISDLIKNKLSEGSLHELVLNLRFILFWGFYALSAFIANPKSDRIEGILNITFSLVEFVFDQITDLPSNCEEIEELVEFLFEHPLITEILPFYLETGDLQLNLGLDEFKTFTEEKLPLVNRCLLRFLTKLYGFLANKGNKSDLSGAKLLLERILELFREKFESCVENGNLGNLIPIYHIFSKLMEFIPLSDLFNLSNSIFALLETKFSNSCFGSEPASISAFICLKIADISMELLFLPDSVINPFLEDKKENFDLTIFQNVYYQILSSATNLNLEFGDGFLFKAIECIYTYRYNSSDLSLSILCSNVFTNTPVKLVNYCIYSTSKIKTKILELIIGISPNHLEFFGKFFMGILNKDQTVLNQLNTNNDFSEGDFVNLLPAALVYVNEIGLEKVREIPVFYSEILLKGFSNWKDFVTRHNLTEKCDKLDINENASFEDFCGYFGKTLLGKTVCMLEYFISLNEEIPKKQGFKILDSIFPESEIMDLGLNSIKFESSNNEETMRLIDEIYSKVSLAKLLLFSDKLKNSKKANNFKQRFITILINSLDRIVRNNLKKSNLEHFILQKIVEIISENKSYLIKLKSLPFLNNFIKSSFIHRFEDPITLKSIRCILNSLSEGNLSPNEILELLLGHSQFIPSLTNNNNSLNPYQFSLLQPVPSIFKSLNISLSKTEPHKSEKTKIELIKLLRVIYHLIKTQNKEESLLKEESKELLFLLLSIYNATIGDLDLEIFNLMKQIENHVGANWGGIAETDYLFGNGVLKIREEMKSEMCNENGDIEERRKFLFRENIPVDSRMSVQTVLGFCFDRSLYGKMFDVESIMQEKFNDDNQGFCGDTVCGYDTEYILQLGINSILNEYIDPIEFCKLGLLAVSFMSISSSDAGTRKLGYEALFRFKSSLENSGKSKEKLQIKLLLTYLQNGISEEWQKIPSLISVFLAEASLTLIDSSKPHFFTISKFLMHNLSANLKSVPLFNSLFQNSSIHFKNDRIWILQLLYAGLNLDDDAKIYKNNNIFENLLSFYSSSTSDPESRLLILKIVKKAAKLPDLLNHLIKECGLLSWLSSVLSLHGELCYTDNNNNNNNNSSEIMDLVLKVINDLLSSTEVPEFIQESGLEQISQISSYLFKHLTRDINFLDKSIPLINSMLQIIITTLKLSQKRKIYQPHFTLSLHGLYKLYQSFDMILNDNNNMEFDQTLELVLDLILMSSPVPVLSHKDKLIFVDIIKWAISASLRLFNKNKTLILEKGKESFISKLLRWITASIIIGRISNQAIKSTEKFHENRPNIKTLDSLLASLIEGGLDCDLGEESGLSDKIGAIILYLKQIVEKNNELNNNNSAVLAICLLLLDSSTQSVKEYMRNNYDKIKEFCSKIHCPSETIPSWRWSYYEAWRDLNSKQTEMEKREEEKEASRRLFVIFSNAFLRMI
ncbi:hypothetical protein LUZ60_009092 [Juncus effusus]|nr:hypothetical protein LUZ60_009092 [Juncus effusus]